MDLKRQLGPGDMKGALRKNREKGRPKDSRSHAKPNYLYLRENGRE